VREDLEGVRLRTPARERRIGELTPEDTFVRILGKVVAKRETEVVLEDEDGARITVFADDPELLSEVREESRVRIFGTPLLQGERREIRAEIVQKMDGLNLTLYREARKEMEKLRRMAGLA
jgi:hypothetical protein